MRPTDGGVNNANGPIIGRPGAGEETAARLFVESAKQNRTDGDGARICAISCSGTDSYKAPRKERRQCTKRNTMMSD